MEIKGHVHDGVVILDGNVLLPNGLPVTVIYADAPKPPKLKHRVTLPLVPSDKPGTLNLTAERIAEVLNEDDCAG
ncbi:MAG TPA: hypothetical protein VGJ15_13075 [Pirellulales bacterium]|jgi:hypothetical protein